MLGASTLGGNLTISASGDLTQTGALSVTGTSNLTVTFASDMTLINGSNIFTGAVTLSSGTGFVQVLAEDEAGAALSEAEAKEWCERILAWVKSHHPARQPPRRVG